MVSVYINFKSSSSKLSINASNGSLDSPTNVGSFGCVTSIASGVFKYHLKMKKFQKI